MTYSLNEHIALVAGLQMQAAVVVDINAICMLLTVKCGGAKILFFPFKLN